MSVDRNAETDTLVNNIIPFNMKSLSFALKRWCQGKAIALHMWMKNGSKSSNECIRKVIVFILLFIFYCELDIWYVFHIRLSFGCLFCMFWSWSKSQILKEVWMWESEHFEEWVLMLRCPTGCIFLYILQDHPHPVDIWHSNH